MKVNCIILAGGKSSRMGIDKGSIYHQGKTVLQKLVNDANAIFQETIIVSNHPNHIVPGAITIKDDIQDIGPIGGLITGLKYSQSEWNFVISADVFLTDLSSIYNELTPYSSKNTEVIIPSQKGKQHFLCGLYRKNAIPVLIPQIDSGEYSIYKSIEKLNYIEVNLDNLPASLFANFNSPEDFPNFDLKLIQVLAFGMVAEILQNEKFNLVTSSKNLNELHEEFIKSYPNLKHVKLKFAVNQSFEEGSYVLQNQDEIALLPPFAGG